MFIDSLFMEFVHFLCVKFGFVMTPFFWLVSFFGEKAWFFLLVALILFFNKKTRWIALTIILSILTGWIIGNFGMKPFIMRMRPYTASNLYQDYWVLAGSFPEKNYSMPSGHTMAVAAFFISLYITCKKELRNRILSLGLIFIILMALSRMYFMHHYFSDCLVGFLISILTSLISKKIIKKFYTFVKNNENIPIYNFLINFSAF